MSEGVNIGVAKLRAIYGFSSIYFIESFPKCFVYLPHTIVFVAFSKTQMRVFVCVFGVNDIALTPELIKVK